MVITLRRWAFIAAIFAASTGFTYGLAEAGELVMFRQDPCQWCDAWDRDIGVTYPKTDEGKQFPLRLVDMHERWPGDLSGIKRVVYSPTFVALENGREIGRIIGYPGEMFFWQLLGEITKKADKPETPETTVQLLPVKN